MRREYSLQIIGEALDTDRVVWENFEDPTGKTLDM